LKKTVRGLRWWIIGLIGVATVINYIDRTSLAVMWPDISKDVGLTKDQYATIVSAFMIAYALGQALSGRLFDKVGTRIGFLLSISAWSLACGLHSIARSITSFMSFRALLGLSEAGNWPGATKACAQWFPAKERALAQGIFNAGASFGAVISAPLIATLYVLLGWKATFVVVAALGLLWIVPWLFVNRSEPENHPWITEEERQHILDGLSSVASAERESRALSWSELLSYRQSWSIIASRFFVDPIWWMFVNWLPIYLAERFGFDVKQIGLFAWFPYVGAAIGSLAGGWWSGHKIKQGWSVNKARKWAIVIGGIISVPALVLAIFASTPISAVVLIAIVLAGFQVMINNIQTLPSDFFSGKSVGSLAGLGGLSAVCGVLTFSTWLIPYLSKISYTPVFITGALLVPLGVASVFAFGGEIKRVQLREK
jgi:ACS family hexuronate transporter-like MFS transporter